MSNEIEHDKPDAITRLRAEMERLREERDRQYDENVNRIAKEGAALLEVERLRAENERLREANGILEDAMQEASDDYPGSSMQEWCRQQVKRARAVLEEKP